MKPNRKESTLICEETRKEYNFIDILKFVLAVLVLLIHSNLDRTITSPLLRIAVPMFFIISAYFFFRKIAKTDSKEQQNKVFARFVQRNLLLYLLWTAIQLPMIIYARRYYENFFFGGLLLMLRNFLFGNSFTGSWYIVASVIGVMLVYWISRKIPVGWILLPFRTVRYPPPSLPPRNTHGRLPDSGP